MKLSLEPLEDRLVLDAMVFAGTGTLAAPANWFLVANWTNLTNPGNPHVPDASDDAAIPASAGVVAIGGGQGAEVNSIATAPGTLLIIAAGPPQPSELKINNNSPFSPVAGYSPFGGSVIDAGRIIANTTNPFTGTNVAFAAGALIGPGDLNGNLDAGPNSSFLFAPPNPFTAGSTGEFAVGATLGPGTGSIIIAASVQVDGTLDDNSETIDLVPGGALFSPTVTTGALNVNAQFNWTGGTIALGLGVTVGSSGEFVSSGPSPLTLDGPLTNDSAFTELGGAGGLTLAAPGLGPGGSGPGGSIVNQVGIIHLSQPTVADTVGYTGGITNDATLDATAPASTPTVITTPFTNTGNLNVESGDALVLVGTTTPTGASTVALDGVMQLLGTLTLRGPVDSPTGFVLDAAPGFLLVGDPSTGVAGTLTVDAGETAVVNGNLEVTDLGTLTGAGKVVNSGRLQLDLGSSTTGLGSYQQTSIGTLALDVAPGGGFSSVLAVLGTAQLSGNLILMDYTPVVGASFVVVTAGAVEDHFDTIPDGMEETDGPMMVTVTQVRPPAGE